MNHMSKFTATQTVQFIRLTVEQCRCV